MEDQSDQMKALVDRALERDILSIRLTRNDAEALRAAFYQWRRGKRILGENAYDGLTLRMTSDGLEFRLFPTAKALQRTA
ncbi:MAG TPA: hypothetical protein VLH56_19035 [Dissulfurispiraceae bacterium]|nr:hypothetical protein [Dissulfurispiraceae bacterium]